MFGLFRKKPKLARNFFQLRRPYKRIKSQKELIEIIFNPDENKISDFNYWPKEFLKSDGAPLKIDDKIFCNFSFSYTHIKNINFQNCIFEECLIKHSKIENCEFHNCKFVNTNTYKSDFIKVYVNPKSFDNCLGRGKYQNVGVILYQKLMRNFSDEKQGEFERYAYFMFNKWKMREHLYKYKKEWNKFTGIRDNFVPYIFRGIWDITGAGVRGGRLLALFVFVPFTFVVLNYRFKEKFGLENIETFNDSIYFTLITMATVGYGDIIPKFPAGKLMIAFEGTIGFFLFALAASILFRRITS